MTDMEPFPENEWQELFPFLEQETDRRNLPIELAHLEKSPVMTRRQVRIPAYVSGNYDPVEKAHLLQTLEDAWNDREPEPQLTLLLLPSFRPSPKN